MKKRMQKKVISLNKRNNHKQNAYVSRMEQELRKAGLIIIKNKRPAEIPYYSSVSRTDRELVIR
jgi:hypothetical protein